MNPMRADMVDRPEEYPWSSYACNAGGHPDPLVTPHALYQGLGMSADERHAA
ncbi:MAG: hypothetical protein ABR553_00185 [Gammaproteobacteria bacterium]